MTIHYMMKYSIISTPFGAPIHAIGLLVTIMLQKFNTRYFQPGTDGVNAFTQNWSHDNNWLFPPPYLLIKAINYAKTCKAQGTPIVPVWKSAHFWLILCPDGVHWDEFMKGCLPLPNWPKLVLKCKAKNTIFGNKQLTFAMVALRIDFTSSGQ